MVTEKIDLDHYWYLTANGPVKRKRETKVFRICMRHKYLVTQTTDRMNLKDAGLVMQYEGDYVLTEKGKEEFKNHFPDLEIGQKVSRSYIR